MVYTVEKVCLFFNTGLSGGRFACYSIIASIEFLQKGSTFLGLRTLFLDGYSWVLGNNIAVRSIPKGAKLSIFLPPILELPGKEKRQIVKECLEKINNYKRIKERTWLQSFSLCFSNLK